ncbi:glycosyltransferase family 4 protein [Sphingomonas bacterium]|uniref:glycosyltransferase family 4 protein n=1 Tax=Sphingomonas bacterium TaxID=1895847 RepID=UPI0015755EDF|nr:glycosyltransferase family 4 protein [Sphingomonas bacterium]
MRVAVVHDWMTLRGGGESCVEQFLDLYPQADLHCLVDFLPEAERGFLAGRRIVTSFIQRLPFARTRYRTYLPLMPIAVEQLDMTGYDLVISTSSAVAKGVITGPDQVHICYTFSPIRYAWDLQETYLRESGSDRGLKGLIARAILHYIRLWDVRTANGVDHFVAISHYIGRRVRKAYGRSSTVIYPPVDLDRFTVGTTREDFYLVMGRMVPYKRVPLLVEAFRAMPERRLVVIGDGPDMAAVRAAAGSNVTLLGKQPNEVVTGHMRRAKAFLFAAEEDFGIAPLEAQACGTPVIAYARGAATETIRGYDGEGQTGVFFHEQTAAAIVAAVDHLDRRLPAITPVACRANAERFATGRFRDEVTRFIDAAMTGTEPAALA